jgi:hypothetical protein
MNTATSSFYFLVHTLTSMRPTATINHHRGFSLLPLLSHGVQGYHSGIHSATYCTTLFHLPESPVMIASLLPLRRHCFGPKLREVTSRPFLFSRYPLRTLVATSSARGFLAAVISSSSYRARMLFPLDRTIAAGRWAPNCNIPKDCMFVTFCRRKTFWRLMIASIS